MQRAKMRDRLREHRLHLILLADVRFDGDGAPTHRFNLMRDVFRRGGISDVVNDDVGAGFRQPQRDSHADARIGARDDRGLTDERGLIRRRGRAIGMGRRRRRRIFGGLVCHRAAPAQAWR